MGVAYFVTLERDIDGLDTMMSGKALSSADFEDKCEKTITRIAQELGITPLTDFLSFSLDTILGHMELTREEAPQNVIDNIKPEEWFDPGDGIASASALISFLTEHPTVTPNVKWVISDLEEIIRILTVAQENGVRWHLEIDV